MRPFLEAVKVECGVFLTVHIFKLYKERFYKLDNFGFVRFDQKNSFLFDDGTAL